MRWFISDTHFGHGKVIRYSGRPFKSVREMDDYMIARWNEKVKGDDEVYFLGDFGLASFDYLCDVCLGLNGSKILIRGNHDGTVAKMKRMGFDCVLEKATLKMQGYDVDLSHYPVGDMAPRLTLHGHVHEKGSKVFKGNQLCLCVELWDYSPVSEKTIHREILKWKKRSLLL